jgi:hypothetical protein
VIQRFFFAKNVVAKGDKAAPIREKTFEKAIPVFLISTG